MIKTFEFVIYDSREVRQLDVKEIDAKVNAWLKENKAAIIDDIKINTVYIQENARKIGKLIYTIIHHFL